MIEYNNQNQAAMNVRTMSTELTNAFLRKVYSWMLVGLALTGTVAYFASTSRPFLMTLFTNKPLLIGLIIAQLGLVMALSWGISKMSPTVASACFLLYSGLTGLSLAPIFVIYNVGTIYQAFFTSAGMFGAMSIYAMTTKRDLRGMGSFMIMGLFGIIIASIINIWVGSSAMSFGISILGVIIFCGLTAYDTQKILQMGDAVGDDLSGESAAVVHRGAIMGALTLYLDFINMFLMLLRLFGNRD